MAAVRAKFTVIRHDVVVLITVQERAPLFYLFPTEKQIGHMGMQYALLIPASLSTLF